MTGPEVPTGQTEAVPVQTPPVLHPRPRPSWAVLIASAVIAVILGFGGGVASRAAFRAPAVRGPKGAPGAQGPVGETGPAGPPGTAANVSLSKIGFCLTVSTHSSSTGFYAVNGVYISPPTDKGGVLSCSSGRYITLEPTLPTGKPATTYKP